MATVDGKKEEFRQYLEKSGVIDALTKGERNNGDLTKKRAEKREGERERV